jgi:hypothetical protein
MMSLALEQPQHLDPTTNEYVRDWFVRREDMISDRFLAWSCYCLQFAGLGSLLLG